MNNDKRLIVGIIIVFGMAIGLVAALLFIAGGSGSSEGCIFVQSGKAIIPVCP